MAKKKKTTRKPSFSESIGITILQNDAFNFLFGILLFAFTVWMIIAFISFFSTAQYDQSIVLDMRPQDYLNTKQEIQNACGPMGALISNFFITKCFGFAAFMVPAFLIIVALKMIRVYKNLGLLKSFLCMSVAMIWASMAFAQYLSPFWGNEVYNPGGAHGEYCSQWLTNVIGAPGLVAVLVIIAITFLTYISSETISFVRKCFNPVGMISDHVTFSVSTGKAQSSHAENQTPITANESDIDDVQNVEVEETEKHTIPSTQVVEFPIDDEPVVKINPASLTDDIESGLPADGEQKITDISDPGLIVKKAGEGAKSPTDTVADVSQINTPINHKEPWTNYKYPTLSLLDKSDNGNEPYIDMKEQTANKNRIVEVLGSFGVQIRTISATVGPTITLYEITPNEGVRISKIRNLEDDIALSLKAKGVRIIAPIPGKGTIGIEVPNAKPSIVSIESILNSEKFQSNQYELPLALGKTITNEVYMVDLAKIPHLLVAGATGQGKSVGLNAIITSLLYKKHPNEMKLVLIDPKKVEFSIYSTIAKHFMAQVSGDDEEPIITDVKKVVRTLNSLCKLMDTRYDLLKMAGARNIKEYNKKYLNHQLRLTDGHEYMPYIVVIIDEFGDLIMQVGKEVEFPIARIAQLARAVGIHMVIATQRPTTSIITGNIKTNFPGRMAFKVSQMNDSRVILDRPGANQLIGRGDMLMLNGNEPVRVQCAYVDTDEVERVNEYIASQPGPTTPMELPEPDVDAVGEGGGNSGLDGKALDSLFEEAARLVIISQSGSTSNIQRKFGIGYNRAGRLMDQLEKAGIVGAAQGSKPREVLVQDESTLQNILIQLHS